MNTILIIVSVILMLIAGVVTFYAFKQEEKKMAKYKEENLSAEDARKRSQDYEKESVSSVVPLQIWAYLATAVFTVIIVIIFGIYY